MSEAFKGAFLGTLFAWIIIWLVLFLFIETGYGQTVEDMRKELTMVQLKISEEEARYQSAKAQMERAQVVAQYLFPELRLREKQLMEKIDQMQNGNKNDK